MRTIYPRQNQDLDQQYFTFLCLLLVFLSPDGEPHFARRNLGQPEKSGKML